jgi:hypothetical protein
MFFSMGHASQESSAFNAMLYVAEIAKLMREVDRCNHNKDYRRMDQLYRVMRRVQQQAEQEFAELNGWRCSAVRFSPDTLRRGSHHDGATLWQWVDHTIWDHCVFFKRRGWPVAIVTQPYNTRPAEARRLIGPGLRLHVPADHTASFWNPGWCRFYVVTGPDIEVVRFLPEQMTMRAARQGEQDGDVATQGP